MTNIAMMGEFVELGRCDNYTSKKIKNDRQQALCITKEVQKFCGSFCTDKKGCLLALERGRDNLGAVQKVFADGGYTGKAFASSVQELIGAEVEIVKRNELHRFAVLPKRWVVERGFSWLEKNRRLWKNCERKLSTRLQMVVLAFLGVLLRRL